MIGVIIMTSFKWNNEIATLSLAASLGEIFKEFLEQKNSTVRSVPRQLCNSQHKCKYIPTCSKNMHSNQMKNNDINLCTIDEKCTVLIQNGLSWGTGCLLRIFNKRMLITCSHVIWVTYLNNILLRYIQINISICRQHSPTISSARTLTENFIATSFTSTQSIINLMM